MTDKATKEKKKGRKEEDSDDDIQDDDWSRFEIKISDFDSPKIDEVIDKIINIMSDTAEDLKEEKKLGPYVWGFSLTITPDRKPIIREFGNIKKRSNGVSIQEKWEPLIDIIDEKNELIIIVEIPGITEDQIKIQSFEDYCELNIIGQKKYYKKIDFPNKVQPSSAQIRYKNGILELTYKKKD
ncbi:MAG: Hsp20/alpha crystallin family protein [Candidatus Helarchaeota archaeon]